MSRPKPGQPGDELKGSNEVKSSKESQGPLARLYHPQTLEVIEKIASLAATSENDRKRLMDIVTRQRALMQAHDIEPESINRQLPQTNFEGYLANLLSEEGAIERDSLIMYILQRDAMATASTIPPSMPQVALASIIEEAANDVDMALHDAERLEKLHDEVYGKGAECKREAKTRPRFLDIDEGDKFLVLLPKSDCIFPGDVLNVVRITFENQTLIRVENQTGKYFILDPDTLKQIAKKANPNGNN
ncbi:hypothetical protein IT413_00835 [Candidatus Peregrinibacteria bacterium]|nr:hypothetical protein [Candidatus Peregrinibacteria bacterium]